MSRKPSAPSFSEAPEVSSHLAATAASVDRVPVGVRGGGQELEGDGQVSGATQEEQMILAGNPAVAAVTELASKDPMEASMQARAKALHWVLDNSRGGDLRGEGASWAGKEPPQWMHDVLTAVREGFEVPKENCPADAYIREAIGRCAWEIHLHSDLAPERAFVGMDGPSKGPEGLQAWVESHPGFQAFFEAEMGKRPSLADAEGLEMAYQAFLHAVGERLCEELRHGAGAVNPKIPLDGQGMPRHFTDLGGYPIFYLTKDGSVVSPEAVEENLALTNDPDDPQWYVTGADINWEDEHLVCDHTGQPIPCAYRDDSAPEAEGVAGVLAEPQKLDNVRAHTPERLADPGARTEFSGFDYQEAKAFLRGAVNLTEFRTPSHASGWYLKGKDLWHENESLLDGNGGLYSLKLVNPREAPDQIRVMAARALAGPMDPRISEWRELPDGVVVHRFNIITTPRWVYVAMEPTRNRENPDLPQHSTITTSGGPEGNRWVGRIGSRELPEHLNAMPVGDERYNAVMAWHQAQYKEAYEKIIQAFPEAQFGGIWDMGEITLHLPEEA